MSRPLSPQSWQYRQLNSRAPTLSTLSDTLIELAEQGHPVVASTCNTPTASSASPGAIRNA